MADALILGFTWDVMNPHRGRADKQDWQNDKNKFSTNEEQYQNAGRQYIWPAKHGKALAERQLTSRKS